MSLHDAYARLTPFEIAFPERSQVQELSARVAEEAGGRGADDALLEAFVTTEAAGVAARELRGPEAPPESTLPFAALLFHAVHFLRAGCPLYLLTTGAVRTLTEPHADVGGTPAHGATPIEPPMPAGYLQLPQHLVWTGGSGASGQGGAEAGRVPTPESLDGVFWTLSRSRMLHALLVSGMRPDRPGFGALPVPAAPMGDAPRWLDAQARATGEDFASQLPGGELDRLYAVEAAGEVLKLLARFFVALPAASSARAEAPAAVSGDPPASSLPYTRVTLGS